MDGNEKGAIPVVGTPADVSAAVRLEDVSKVYPDGTVAVRSLTLDVPTGELLCLVGPSGCGKSTTMRMVNRLVEPSSGRIYVDGRDVTDADPVELRRGIGYVIQQVGLFPHRTVADNVATVPRLTGASKEASRKRALELLELVGLDPSVFAKRYPAQLSGGQRQRVGVARALAADPPVLLMDEPFSAIDPIARDRLQEEFLRVQREVRKTILFVTHDIDEAVRLGDRIAVFKEGGQLEQVATPADLLAHPATPSVAAFVGADRGLRRLRVVPLSREHLLQVPVLAASTPVWEAKQRALGNPFVLVGDASAPTGWLATFDADGTVGSVARPLPTAVVLGSSLDQAFGQVLTDDAGWAPVLSEGRYVGVLTPEVVHATLRAS